MCAGLGVSRAVRTWPSRPAQAVFKVAPSMTKHEVKEHLTKIYDLPVQRVMTANFAGARVCLWTSSREREMWLRVNVIALL